MKSVQKALLLVMVIFSGAIISACASEPSDTGSDGADGEDGESTGGDLVVATMSDAVTLDPAGSNDVPSRDIQYNIFERLINQNEEMELEPGLALSWEAIDETTWEFKLREDVTFHDGSPFNAEVVKANVERILDPDVGSSSFSRFEMITDIEIVDDYTIKFITEYPYSPLPYDFAHGSMGMVSLEQINEDYEAMEGGEEPGSVVNSHPIGTGYFKFDEWIPGQQVVLTNNEDYWGEENAKLDTVTFKVVPEDLTRLAELETGESHITNPLSPSDVEKVHADEALTVLRQQSLGIEFVGFNVEKEPFDDERVRRAISMAIDKEQILEGIYDHVGAPAIGPLAPDVFGYDESISTIEYDPEGAKELLDESGFADGLSATIWTNESRERVDIVTNIQAQLAEIGVDLDIEILEWGAFLDETSNGSHEMYVMSWNNATADADNGLHPLFHSSSAGTGGNKMFARFDELDELLDEGRRTVDEEERQAIYKDAQEFLAEQAPMVYLVHPEYLLGVREEVKNLAISPGRVLLLKDVYIE